MNTVPFVHHINGFSAEFEIVNSEGKSIAQQTMGFPCGSLMYGSDVAFPIRTNAVDITFSAVDPYDITDTLTIRISRIDGQPTEQIASQRNISIMTSAEYSRLPEVRANIAVFDYEKPKVLINDIERRSPSIWYYRLPDTTDGGYTRIKNTIVIAVIPYGVTSISDWAFFYESPFGYERKFAVIIPDTVTSIGYRAFFGNDMISVTIGANVSMGESFPNGIASFYNRNGKKAGTFTYNESTEQWSFKAR